MKMFQIMLTLHIVCGVICLLAGAIAAATKKRKGPHTLVGEFYHASYVGILITSTVMAVMHWETSAYLFFIALFSYGLALYGYLARKQKWKNWLRHHIPGMLGSYIGVITAVLVVNGHKIPVINQLPDLLLWFLPTILGSPLIGIVIAKYSRPKRQENYID